jgi:hypothetical protein
MLHPTLGGNFLRVSRITRVWSAEYKALLLNKLVKKGYNIEAVGSGHCRAKAESLPTLTE